MKKWYTLFIALTCLTSLIFSACQTAPANLRITETEEPGPSGPESRPESGPEPGPESQPAAEEPLPESGPTLPEQLRLYVEMETTSDWTHLNFLNEVRIIRGMVTAYSRGVKRDMSDTSLGLNRKSVVGEVGKPATLEAIVLLELPDLRRLEFEIVRGHRGAAAVRLYRVESTVAVLIDEYRWDGMNAEDAANLRVFSITADDVPASRSPADLDYPAEQLDEIFHTWVSGIKEFASPPDKLYWQDAEHVLIIPGRSYQVKNAVRELRAEFMAGPQKNVDYTALHFSDPLHIPYEGVGAAKLVTFGSYKNELGWADVFWFEKRGNGWKISQQVYKLGVELP